MLIRAFSTPAAFVALVVLPIACAGRVTTSPNDGGASPDDAASDGAAFYPDGAPIDLCKGLADRATRCGDGFDPTSCAKEAGCYDRVIKPADRAALVTCFVTRDCAASEDSCVATVSGKYGTDPTVLAYNKACLDKRAACGTTFPSDYCGFDLGMLQPDLLAKLRACYDGPCAEVGTCYEAVVAGIGCR
jgi:hypothetical protein